MNLNIQKAERQRRKARIALAGPSGSGKSYSALRIARGLVGNEGRILFLDTERGSGLLYSDVTDFDHADLPDYEYETYIQAIKQAEQLKYDCLIIDSASHAWQEFLEQHSKMQGNSYVNWSKITPKYNQLIQAIVNFDGHIIVTMRAKTKYEMDEKGRPVRNYIGTIMRDGTEYEFDVVGMIDIHHNMSIEKTRVAMFADKIITKPGEEFGAQLAEWLAGGKEVVKKSPVTPKNASFSDLFKKQAYTAEEDIQALPYSYEFPEKMTPEEKMALFEDAIRAGGCFSKQTKLLFFPEPFEALEGAA